ncbi:hypothetical protein FACS1894170_03380 [Planctomycetales bacterium]|nr:hypothetical protein FACS1894170_03380 [Planctomycetales bacterium]
MGKQTYFYMNEDDENRFLDFARENGNVRIVPVMRKNNKIEILDSLPEIGVPYWYRCYLWNAGISSEPILEYIERQNYYLVDEYKSEIIHFNRTDYRGNIRIDGKIKCDPGRIFIDHKIWGENELISRSQEFLDWYEKLARWIRKNGVYRTKGGYVFPGMIELLKNNEDYIIW